ncbi:hypothetical protein ASD65_06670 [Microbacterium sp. Root61]|uniref:anti-sigma factor n=1 Tax=Microbacterium sp. Root61 TaxID=1736570 RepID=UPI0006F54738|nr:anti-sigma factor [Microbacterium sp. Root61]KRA24144.1 hypothetical protein ASD65_06670 [Microbacterium sp. Root61]
MNEQDFAELAAGHALHALSPEDEREYLAALAAHPEWAELVATDAAIAVALADTVADATPPIGVRSALLAQIADLPQDVAAPVHVSTEPASDTATIQAVARRNWTRGLLALAASSVLLLGLGFGAVLLGQQLNRPASVIALEQIEAAPDAQSASVSLEDGGDATAHWSGSLGKAVLVSDGLPTIADDQDFELWFVREGTAISAGVFDADDGNATAVLTGEMHAGDVIAVTVEQAGGSPSGGPTTDPIVTIPTA